MAASSWRERALRIEQKLNARSASPRARKVLLGTAFALFVAVSVTSFGSLKGGVHFHWWVLPILVLVTTPLTAAANAGEYRVMGRISGHEIGWRKSIQLTIVVSAANLLPLPGGLVVRTQALRQEGTSYKRALAANAAAGLAWIGMGCFAAAVLLVFQADHRWLSAGLALGGLVAVVAVWLLLRRASRAHAPRHLQQLLVVEGFTVVVSAVRIALAFHLIGLPVRPAQAVALTSSVIIAAAVGIFPAGLGLREVLAGAVGAAVDLSASHAVAATAADRVTAQIGLAMLAGAMLFSTRTRKQVDEELTGEAEAPDHPRVAGVDLP